MSAVTLDILDGWARITLNRPERLNAFNSELKTELLAALAQVADDEACRAVLLTGAGRGFCAGQDLQERQNAGASAESFRTTLEAFYNPLVLAIRSMKKPVVCAVNGVAAGAGANLALACDFVIAARSVRFIQAFSNIGLTPDSGGSWFLPRLVGDARARGLFMLGLPVTAEEAQAWGMIWKAVDDERLGEEAQSLVGELVSRPTLALANVKRLLDQSCANSLEAQLEAEAQSQEQMGNSRDYREGVSAFMEKRRPDFRGS